MSELIIGVDPGSHCGWAKFEDGHNIGLGVLNGPDEIFDWISEQQPTVWVCEDYKIRPPSGPTRWSHQWSSVFPIKVIGAIEYHGRTHGIPVVLQQPSIKRVAAGRSGLINYDTKKRGAHAMDAYLHASYYLNVTCRKNAI
jgi:hypothetical protein